MKRFSIYVYSLIYPALLGTFVFGLITLDLHGTAKEAAIWLMVAYFVTQYAEGVITAKPGMDDSKYAPADLVFDLLDMAMMVLVLAALGAFDAGRPKDDLLSAKAQLPGLPIDPGRDQWLLMAIVFLLPPLERRLGGCGWWDTEAKRGQRAGFDFSLSILSIVAALGALGGYLWDWLAVFGAGLAFAVYFVAFIVCEPPVPKTGEAP